ncbi:hypothetical protein A9C19_00015 [Bacillus weihaiensis]|uniref:Uncharacterized protein n=1 Tax=Bacillus weihaiensis TaxID=1547283 RepID=A0A1L3MLI9_9BACI|nr:type VII secretion protein EssB/YukC [Bacillus weihaiensis]APH03265.1 hypothetical protein A9C19_00015 [Bacillus weihaiensis]
MASCMVSSFALFQLLFIPCIRSFLSNQSKRALFKAQEFFLQDQYSDVVTELQPYEIDDMPIVTQYELAFLTS